MYANCSAREIEGVRPQTSAELAELILEKAEVAVVPGEAFGPSGYLRLSYALSDEDLTEVWTACRSSVRPVPSPDHAR